MSLLVFIRRAVLFTLVLVALAVTTPARASDLPNNFSESIVAGGFSTPTAMAFAPDGRLFVLRQNGEVRVIEQGQLLGTPFVSLSVNSSGERGLLGIAFAPDFETNQYIYLYYTTSASPVHNRISRFTANGNVALPNSEVVLMDLEPLSSRTNHNGGALGFGPDGKLYVAVGENATSSNSQTLNNRLGKILRLNPDGTIPTDNPFYDEATGDNRAIWAMGLRNPFTFSFGGGRMFINDVGAGTWEEVNLGVAGSNYGWPTTEGETSNPNFRSPLFVYPHGSGDSAGCAIAGSTVYDTPVPQFPAGYLNDYFFADYCNGWIRRYNPATDSASLFATNAPDGIVDLDVGPDGALYYLTRDSGGRVFRIAYGQSAPVITLQPEDELVTVGQSARFECSASASPAASYQWQRGSDDIPGATSRIYTFTPVLGDDGAQFRCVATNTHGTATSDYATLTVTSNAVPSASITSPAVGALYRGGQTITFGGTASDPEDGALPDSAYTWWVDFHHDTHTHPAVLPFSGATGGEFDVPREGETSVNVWYRIHLEVTDSTGLTHHVTRDMLPRTARVEVTSSQPGLQINLDGQPTDLPISFLAVVGTRRELDAFYPQTVSGTNWMFGSWSDGRAASHMVTIPASGRTYHVTWDSAEPPPAPTLRSPANNAQIGDQTPTFLWNAAARAVEYQFVLDDSAGFGSPLIVELVDGTELPAPMVLPFGTYFWRARGANLLGEWSDWSATRTLIIESTNTETPMRNVFDTASPVLRWNRLTWAAGYEVEVDNNSTFSSPEFEQDDLGADTLEAQAALPGEGRYWWRVRGRRADGTWGNWSAVDSFTVDTP